MVTTHHAVGEGGSQFRQNRNASLQSGHVKRRRLNDGWNKRYGHASLLVVGRYPQSLRPLPPTLLGEGTHVFNRIAFVDDFQTHERLDDILHGNQAREATVLVDDLTDHVPAGQKLLEQIR